MISRGQSPDAPRQPPTFPAKRRAAGLLVAFGAGVLLAGCAQNFALHRRDPLRADAGKFPPQTPVAAGVRAQQSGHGDQAAGCYLDALATLDGAARAGRTDDNDAAATARTFATARLVEICAGRLLPPHAPPLLIDGPGGRRYRVTMRRGAGPGGIAPDAFASLYPTDRYAVTRVPGGDGRRPGAGATLVGELPPVAPPQKTERPTQPIAGLCWSVTAVAVFGPAENNVRPVALELYEPHDAETVATPHARREPLAGDFTMPSVLSRELTRRRVSAISGFLHGDKYFGNAGIYPSEAPTPDKTPVIFVHGLISDPRVYRYLAHGVETDPELRRRYQVWYFFYPTGLPVVVSAALLRAEMRKAIDRLDPGRRHPALHRAVLVGHSMGGLVSRLNVSDSEGDTLYRFYFRKSFEQLNLTSDRREKVRDAMFFHASPDVGGVVFIATPHRGSELTHSVIGSLGRGLVSLPRSMVNNLRGIIADNADAISKADLRDESSIFNLRPESTLARAMAALPIRARRIYTIVGNRARPDPVEQSSDGVVAYRSAHLPQAVREKVVPTGHTGTLESPDTVAEVRRILHEEAAREP